VLRPRPLGGVLSVLLAASLSVGCALSHQRPGEDAPEPLDAGGDAIGSTPGISDSGGVTTRPDGGIDIGRPDAGSATACVEALTGSIQLSAPGRLVLFDQLHISAFADCAGGLPLLTIWGRNDAGQRIQVVLGTPGMAPSSGRVEVTYAATGVVDVAGGGGFLELELNTLEMPGASGEGESYSIDLSFDFGPLGPVHISGTFCSWSSPGC